MQGHADVTDRRPFHGQSGGLDCTKTPTSAPPTPATREPMGLPVHACGRKIMPVFKASGFCRSMQLYRKRIRTGELEAFQCLGILKVLVLCLQSNFCIVPTHCAVRPCSEHALRTDSCVMAAFRTYAHMDMHPNKPVHLIVPGKY